MYLPGRQEGHLSVLTQADMGFGLQAISRLLQKEMKDENIPPWGRLPPGLLLQVPGLLRCRSLRGAPPHTGSHTHWLAGVAEGFLELFRGCLRSWLSSWRSRFSSHMSTEALWEAF